MEQRKADILAFGAHSDDVEIGMAGTIAKWTAAGKQVVICELTEAELSSNGTVELRKEEAATSASILGVCERINLQLPDRGLFLIEENIRIITEVIRKYQPTLIFAPYHEDRHPDHANCAKLIKEAFFSAGIRKYNADVNPAHKARNLFHYFINGYDKPDFVIDISDTIDQKKSALSAYQSQFFTSNNGVQTPLTDGYIEKVVARERLFGSEVGTKYAEGFMANTPILINENLFGEQL